MANTNPYLTFNSPSSFTLATANSTKNWDGELEYSTDLISWNTWDGTTTLNSSSENPCVLYLRGIGNSIISGGIFLNTNWTLTGSNISCIGNIENLLDYETVIVGGHPNMDEYCYSFMFWNCINLAIAPELPSTTLAENCYFGMFLNCTSLIAAPELPATTLANNCYAFMFAGCTSLTMTPELPATTLAESCYNSMFEDCTGLTIVPKLPATTLAGYCYSGMFARCTSLTTPPELPATTLAENCYYYMFNNCTSLVIAPKLPATILEDWCYANMFSNCTSLTIAPELPATTLANWCYYQMFNYCIRLTTPPELSAATLAENCYNDMFQDAGFTISETKTSATSYPYRIPFIGDGTTATDALTDMFSGVAGNIPTPEINKTYYISHRPIGGLKVKEVKKNKEIIDIKHYHIYTDSTLTESAYTDSAFGAEALYDAYGITDTEYNTLTALIG